MTTCRLVIHYRYFGRYFCLHLQGSLIILICSETFCFYYTRGTNSQHLNYVRVRHSLLEIKQIYKSVHYIIPCVRVSYIAICTLFHFLYIIQALRRAKWLSQTSPRRTSASVTGQSLWVLWWAILQWHRLLSEHFDQLSTQNAVVGEREASWLQG